MKRPVTERDLQSKGLPFECENCGNKPTVEDVIEFQGACGLCRDHVTAYTSDAAEWIQKALAERAELLAALRLCIKTIGIIRPHLNNHQLAIAHEAYIVGCDVIAKLKAGKE